MLRTGLSANRGIFYLLCHLRLLSHKLKWYNGFIKKDIFAAFVQGSRPGGAVNILISGGCKNGKSYFAQHLAKQQAGEHAPLYYVATMLPADEEDQARVRRHQAERDGWGFTTLERSNRIGTLEADFSGSFLLDSVTALLSNEMFGRDGTVDEEAYLRVAAELEQLAEKSGNIIFVSDYIYSDAMKYEELTELYRKGLAWIDRTLAQKCDAVIEVAYGNIHLIKDDRNLQIIDL